MSSELHVLPLVRETLAVFWAGAGRFLLVTLVLMAPLVAYQFRVASAIDPIESRPFTEWEDPEKERYIRYSLVVLLLSFFLGQLVPGALAFGVLRIVQGQGVGFFETVSVGFASFFRILGPALYVGVLVLAGSCFFVIPGLLALLILFVAVPCAAVEGGGIFRSLGRSLELTRGSWLVVLGLLLSIQVVALLLGFALAWPLAGLGVGGRLTSIGFTVLSGALQGTASALLYFRLRILREDVDLETLSKLFD